VLVVFLEVIEKYYNRFKYHIFGESLDTKIGIIGVGNMGGALVTALNNSGYNNLWGSTIPENLKDLEKYEINATTDNNEVVQNSDVIVLCVKPQILAKITAELEVQDKLYISMAAGITLNTLYDLLGTKRIVRVMPNIGLKYSESATAYVIGDACTENDENIVNEIFNTAGVTIKSTEE